VGWAAEIAAPAAVFRCLPTTLLVALTAAPRDPDQLGAENGSPPAPLTESAFHHHRGAKTGSCRIVPRDCLLPPLHIPGGHGYFQAPYKRELSMAFHACQTPELSAPVLLFL